MAKRDAANGRRDDGRRVEELLRELIELQKASIRLQKHAICLQSELMAYLSFPTLKEPTRAALEKYVMRSVTQSRAVSARIEAGRKPLK